MKSDFKAVKAVQIIFGAIILSCCIFGGIYGIGVNGLTIFFNNSRYIYDHESPYVQEFQQYVSQNNIATSDISECDEWMDYHCVLFCIIEKDGEQTGYEGCLSLPGKSGVVTRSNHVVVRAYDENMELYELEGTELLARAIQHECDHLDGIMYVDKVEGRIYDNEELEDE